MRSLIWYNNVTLRKPIITKSITSFITFGIGDLICQQIEKSTAKKQGKVKKLDFIRLLKQSVFGFVFTPYFHFHFSSVIPYLFPAVKGASVNTRVLKSLLYDQTVHAALFTVVFYFYMGMVNGRTVKETNHEISVKFLPTMIDNWKLWPLAMYINYKYIPNHLSPLYVNLVGIVWLTYLSYLQNIKFAKV